MGSTLRRCLTRGRCLLSLNIWLYRSTRISGLLLFHTVSSLDHVVFTVSLNCLEWICGLSSTRWSVLDVGLGTDPAATTMTNATPQKSCSIWSQSSILREVCVDTNCSVENVAMTPGATWRERITSHRTCFCFHSSSSEHVGHFSGSWCLVFHLPSLSTLQVDLPLCSWCGRTKGCVAPWRGCTSTTSTICRCANVRFK